MYLFRWRGRCDKCQKNIVKGAGIFCGNFFVGRRQYPPCHRVWCGGCYIEHNVSKGGLATPFSLGWRPPCQLVCPPGSVVGGWADGYSRSGTDEREGGRGVGGQCCLFLLFAWICHQQIAQLYIQTQNNTRTSRGIKTKPTRTALSCHVLSSTFPSRPVTFVSCRAGPHHVLNSCVVSSLIASCPVLYGHVALCLSHNFYLGVTNTHTQHHNLSVTTTSRPVPLVSCQVRSRCVLSCRVLSCPILSCPARSCPVPSCLVTSRSVRCRICV